MIGSICVSEIIFCLSTFVRLLHSTCGGLEFMTQLDWFLVIVINGSIVLIGLWLAQGTRNSVDWFLAAKRLPWWVVGLSMFATAVDSGDYVAVAGGAYAITD